MDRELILNSLKAIRESAERFEEQPEASARDKIRHQIFREIRTITDAMTEKDPERAFYILRNGMELTDTHISEVFRIIAKTFEENQIVKCHVTACKCTSNCFRGKFACAKKPSKRCKNECYYRCPMIN